MIDALQGGAYADTFYACRFEADAAPDPGQPTGPSDLGFPDLDPDLGLPDLGRLDLDPDVGSPDLDRLDLGAGQVLSPFAPPPTPRATPSPTPPLPWMCGFDPAYYEVRDLSPAQQMELRFLASCAFNTVRGQYRGGHKSSNKVRIPRDVEDQRGLADLVRWQRAIERHYDLWVSRASLAQTRAAKVGNCGEMSRAAAVEARALGLQSAVWGFMDKGGTSIPHEFAVVRLAGPRAGAGAAYQERYLRHFNGRQDFWVVDPWAGICCAGSEYDARFIAKMQSWTQQNKHICAGGEWWPSNDFAWLHSTVGKPRLMTVEHVDPAQSVRR